MNVRIKKKKINKWMEERNRQYCEIPRFLIYVASIKGRPIMELLRTDKNYRRALKSYHIKNFVSSGHCDNVDQMYRHMIIEKVREKKFNEFIKKCEGERDHPHD